MKLALHPDPGIGHSWRLTLEVGDVELAADVAKRDHPSRGAPIVTDSFEAALQVANRVAAKLGLVMDQVDDGGNWTWSER